MRDGLRARLFGGRPCDLPGCAASTNPSVSFAHRFSPFGQSTTREDQVRAIGLDVHRDFCEVAIAEGGEVRSAGRIETTPQALELFAGSLGRDDRVVLEVTGNAFEIARIVEPHVAQVIVSARATPASARHARRPTGSTPARSRSCWPRVHSRACGCRTSASGRCAGAFSGARGWCGPAPGPRTRSTGR